MIDIKKVENIAKDAGSAVMEIYSSDFEIEYKDDKSPLTIADKRANEIICSALTKLYPDIPILSEENRTIPYEERKNWDYYWCIDPLDGTKEFIKRNGEFTINIALIHANKPIVGVVYAPAIDILYSAIEGKGAYRNRVKLPIEINNQPQKYLRVVASKSHLSVETQEYIDRLSKTTQHIEQVSKGSSLKLCMVAEGSADIYPRMAPTMEWDTAAADAIVREAGAMTYRLNRECEIEGELLYNKENLLNPWFVVRR